MTRILRGLTWYVILSKNTILLLPDVNNRWELPVLRYHSITVNYHYPFLGVIVLVILHDFIRQNHHKKLSYRYPFFLIMVNYPIFPLHDPILYLQMYYQYLFILQKYPNNVSILFKNSAILGIEVLIETIVSEC